MLFFIINFEWVVKTKKRQYDDDQGRAPQKWLISHIWKRLSSVIMPWVISDLCELWIIYLHIIFCKFHLGIFSNLNIFWISHRFSRFIFIEENYTGYSKMCWIILLIRWKVCLYIVHPIETDFYLSTHNLGLILWLT